MKYPIKSVHGHTHSELESLIEDSCKIFDDFVSLEQISIGGWSNINIRGSSSDFEFVLKLPWSTLLSRENPYEQLYKISLHYAKLNIAPYPIETGRLRDSASTPYLIMEYTEGTTLSSIMDANLDQIISLKESLRILRSETPKDIPRFSTPAEYLKVIHKKTESNPQLPNASREVHSIRERYIPFFHQTEAMIDVLGYWNQNVMHGDLWIPNILFRPGQEALLLDYDACAYGDSRYDLSYLIEGKQLAYVPQLIDENDIDYVNSLRPLVLSCIIEWCIDRLLSMEAGIVEQNLNSPKIRKTVVDYTNSKVNRLQELLST